MTTTKTMWLMKNPLQSVRYAERWVRVEVLRAEEKVSEAPVIGYVDDPERTAVMGFPCHKRVQAGTREVREAGFVVREAGKRPKWVPADRLSERKPAA